MTKFGTLNNNRLKEVLRSHDLITTGNKADMVKRLFDELGTDEIQSSALENILNPNKATLQDEINEMKLAIQNMSKVIELLGRKSTNQVQAATSESLDQQNEVKQHEYNDAEQDAQSVISLKTNEINYLQPERNKYSVREIADTIPDFDPTNDKTLTAEQFIEYVQSAMEAYGFDTKFLLLAVNSKLKGVARLWLNSQPLLRSWAGFRAGLLNEFGHELDEAELSYKMTNTKRKTEESVVDYCFKMGALGRRYHLSESAIIRFTRQGLNDKGMQNAIAAKKFDTMKQLRETLEEYNMNTPAAPKLYTPTYNKTNYNSQNKTTIKRDPINTNEFKCYNCYEKGHVSRNCPHPQRKERCTICQRTSHKTENCSQRGNKGPSTGVNKISDSDATCQDIVKEIKTSDRTIKAFMDSGSGASVIRDTLAEKLGGITACDKVLTGFAGGKYEVTKMIETVVGIDGNEFEVRLFVVDKGDIPEDVLVGRDIMCRNGSRFIIEGNNCSVQPINLVEVEDNLEPQKAQVIKEIATSPFLW